VPDFTLRAARDDRKSYQNHKEVIQRQKERFQFRNAIRPNRDRPWISMDITLKQGSYLAGKNPLIMRRVWEHVSPASFFPCTLCLVDELFCRPILWESLTSFGCQATFCDGSRPEPAPWEHLVGGDEDNEDRQPSCLAQRFRVVDHFPECCLRAPVARCT
jgi:hypothetical protein